MLGKLDKSKRWLPLLALFVPGSCYAYSAFIPEYNSVFAASAAALTLLTSLGFLYLTLTSSRESSSTLRLGLYLCLTLPAPLITSHVWYSLGPGSALLTVACTWLVYLLGWVAPSIFPRLSSAVYREIWHTRSLPARVLIFLILSVVGTSGAEGAMTGRDIYRTFGPRAAFTILGAMSLVMTLAAPFYLSMALRRRRHGLSEIPSAE